MRFLLSAVLLMASVSSFAVESTIAYSSCENVTGNLQKNVFCYSAKAFSDSIINAFQTVLSTKHFQRIDAPLLPTFLYFDNASIFGSTSQQCLDAQQKGIAGLTGGGTPLCRLLADVTNVGALPTSQGIGKTSATFFSNLISNTLLTEPNQGFMDVDAIQGMSSAPYHHFFSMLPYTAQNKVYDNQNPSHGYTLHNLIAGDEKPYYGVSGGGGSGAGFEVAIVQQGGKILTLYTGGFGGGGGLTSPVLDLIPKKGAPSS